MKFIFTIFSLLTIQNSFALTPGSYKAVFISTEKAPGFSFKFKNIYKAVVENSEDENGKQTISISQEWPIEMELHPCSVYNLSITKIENNHFEYGNLKLFQTGPRDHFVKYYEPTSMSTGKLILVTSDGREINFLLENE